MDAKRWDESVARLAAHVWAEDGARRVVRVVGPNTAAFHAPVPPTAGRRTALHEDEHRFYVVGILERAPNRVRMAVVEWPSASPR